VSAAAAAPRPERPADAAGRRATGGKLRLARRPVLRLGRQSPGALTAAMHPAYSVIVFTTASGAGYGLLIGLSAAILLGFVPRDPVFGFFALGTALALITIGLLTSTFHLGRPARAWRAVMQVGTSWLSREGVAALITYLPAAALGFGWVFGEMVPHQIRTGASLSLIGSARHA